MYVFYLYIYFQSSQMDFDKDYNREEKINLAKKKVYINK